MGLQTERDSPLVSLTQLVREPISRMEWDIEGLAGRGDKLVIYGEWGTFKTFLATDAGLHLAAGRDWMGFKVPKARKVLYVDEEMNPTIAKRRIWRQWHGAENIDDMDIPFHLMSREGVRLNEFEAQKMLTALKRWGFIPDVIVFDAMRRVLVGNEKEGADVARFWANVNPFSRLGISVWIIHHMSKQSSDPTMKRNLRDRASGSTDILAGADSAWALERSADNSASLTPIKNRDQAEAKPIEFLVDSDRDDPDSTIVLRRLRSSRKPKDTSIWGGPAEPAEPAQTIVCAEPPDEAD